jgi:hypothetical protein
MSKSAHNRNKPFCSKVLTRGLIPNGGKTMKRFVILAAAAAIMSSAVYAQATEYYVVQDPATKKCTIVDKKPITTTSVVVGDGKVFKTRTEAETGMKTMKVCTN